MVAPVRAARRRRAEAPDPPPRSFDGGFRGRHVRADWCPAGRGCWVVSVWLAGGPDRRPDGAWEFAACLTLGEAVFQAVCHTRPERPWVH